jgi:hypothetical protein
LDGWANRDLNVGDIVSLAPNLQPFANLLGVDQATVRKVLESWGAGHFDAELALDGKAFHPDGKTSAVLIPPAFGLAGVNLQRLRPASSIPRPHPLRLPITQLQQLCRFSQPQAARFHSPHHLDPTQFSCTQLCSPQSECLLLAL